MTFSRESIVMAFWIAALFDLASGYPGMNVLIGVNAIIKYMVAHNTTRIETTVMKNVVLVKFRVTRC